MPEPKNKKMITVFWIMRLIVIAELVSAIFLKNYLAAMQAVWILLIDEYMKKHPDMTIKDLLAKTDYHQMLAETDFKP